MGDNSKGILEMARGAFLERADYEMKKLVDNILDANTKATAKRTMTLKITLIPDDQRMNVGVSFEVKATLAPTTPVTTALFMAGEDSDGTPQVVEMTPQIPGQMDVYGGEQEAPALLKIVK